MTVRMGCLLVGLWHGEEHEDSAQSGEDREEAEDPTPGYTSVSHEPSDQGRHLSSAIQRDIR